MTYYLGVSVLNVDLDCLNVSNAVFCTLCPIIFHTNSVFIVIFSLCFIARTDGQETIRLLYPRKRWNLQLIESPQVLVILLSGGSETSTK